MPRELLVSDESLNDQNLRIKTAGIDLTRFNGNPVMLFNHIRVDATSNSPILPIGNWVNLRKEGDKLFATPKFQTDGDKFANKISKKFTAGVIRGASIGIVPIEFDEIVNPETGKKEIWILKCVLMEISIVDIPSNQNAVVFYNKKDEPIELKAVLKMAAQTTTKKVEMSKLMFVPGMLGLSADASETAVKDALVKLKSDNAEIVNLKAENDRLKAAAKETREAETAAMVDKAIADKKITGDQRDTYIALAATGFDNVKTILDGMQPQVKLSSIPKGGDANAGKTAGKSYKDLAKNDPAALAELKANNYEEFKALYKADFGKDYRG